MITPAMSLPMPCLQRQLQPGTFLPVLGRFSCTRDSPEGGPWSGCPRLGPAQQGGAGWAGTLGGLVPKTEPNLSLRQVKAEGAGGERDESLSQGWTPAPQLGFAPHSTVEPTVQFRLILISVSLSWRGENEAALGVLLARLAAQTVWVRVSLGGVAAGCLALVCEVAGWAARLFAVSFAELQGTLGVGQHESLSGCPREEREMQPLGMGD